MHNPHVSSAGLGCPMSDLVRRSWDRSRRFGISASDTLMFNEVSKALQQRVRERNRRLTAAAMPEMTKLYNSLANTGWMVACVGDDGLVVEALGGPAGKSKPLSLVLRTGVTLAEDVVGTNGPGCALAERKPVVVNGSDHYLQEAKNFLCVAVPLFDPHGTLLGVLDASCDRAANSAPVLEALAIAGRAVENRVVHGIQGATFIHFHHRIEMLGTPLEGIVALSDDGCLLGLNRAARNILGIDCGDEAQIPFDSLFDIAFHRAIDRLRTTQHSPVSLDSANGMRLLARIGSRQDLAPDTLHAARVVSGGRLPAATGVVAQDARLRQILERARSVFAHDIPVLINGETGTGKEVVARMLHDNGPRASGPFIAINCSSIPATLIESELFGYVDGAFTGGRRGGAVGKLEHANGGTLFLDEIGDMPIELQGRLLRVLQERSLSRIGGTRLIDIDISLICATHRDLSRQVSDGTFREDLFYRINGLRIELPSLRERSDITMLIEQVITEAAAGREVPLISDAAMHALLRYSWPGNIRQLQYVLRLATVFAEESGCIELTHLPKEIVSWPGHDCTESIKTEEPALPQLRQAEISLIRASLLTNRFNISATARRLGISRQTLYRKLQEHGLQDLIPAPVARRPGISAS